MKKNIGSNLLCSGCGVCAGVCPHNAIQIKLVKNGFYRPLIDEKKCNECGLCLDVCPFSIDKKANKWTRDGFLKKKKIFGKVLNVYAGWHRNEKIRYLSASGGVATALSEFFLKQGYQIGGTLFNDKNQMTESFVTSDRKIMHQFSSSKYLPSEYSYIAKFVQKKVNEKILIVGLPCQIAALRKVIGYDNINIILIDVLCARITSYILFKNYLQYFSFKKPNVNFRDKKTGWSNFSISIKENDREYSELFRKSLFGKFFNSKLFTQNACYECNLGSAGVSDITLGDFWNHKKFGKSKQGVSLIIVRNKKGDNILNQIDNIKLFKATKKDLIRSQPHFAIFSAENQKLKRINKYFFEENNFRNIVCILERHLKNNVFKKICKKLNYIKGRYL
jgi:coenzyme F420-reducing hydrogenase beta subunit